MPAASVLLVPVPDAEATVAPFRRGLDPTYRQKMPAHVTVLVPFMPPTMIDDAVIDNLTSLFRGFGGFEFVLREMNWFDKRVLYLEPEPAEPFRLITTAVVKQFPDYPPYEGAFDDIVPHLSDRRARALAKAPLANAARRDPRGAVAPHFCVRIRDLAHGAPRERAALASSAHVRTPVIERIVNHHDFERAVSTLPRPLL